MNILGIETSCDETAASIVVDGRLVRSNVISSQIAIHQAYGGVVPELAARGQIEAIVPVVRAALAEAGIDRAGIDAVAVTQGPGLAGSLIVGVNAAKGLAMSLGVPLVPVNHVAGHVYANWLEREGIPGFSPPALPAVCLLVSGGHTELLLIEAPGQATVLGQTIDDAAGEAFDKGARLLGLGYPGGPAIQRAAVDGDATAFAFPRSMPGPNLDFSFSGLKTALLREVTPFRLPDHRPPRDPQALFPEHRAPIFRDDLPGADLAASFEAAIVDVLVRKTVRAGQAHGARSVLIAGGVAANAALRSRLATAVTEAWPSDAPEVRWPHLALCTDNAAMIAGLGYLRWQEGMRGGMDLDVYPRWPIDAPSPPERGGKR